MYLEDIGEGLPGQLVLDDGEEFAERLQEGRWLQALAQQVLHRGQDVDFCLLQSSRSNTFIQSTSKGTTHSKISLFFPNKLYCNAFNLKSYLRIVGSLEVGQQQADKHRALLLLTHKSADPKKQ